MFIRLGDVEIREPDVQTVAYPWIGGGFEFSGAVLGDKGREIHRKLRIFKKGDKRNFALEDDKGRKTSGVAEITNIELNTESIDEQTLWKYWVECRQTA